MKIGDTRTVSYEESKALRKQGWKPRNDMVVMMYVGLPEARHPLKRAPRDPETLSQTPSAIKQRNFRARRDWSAADHAYVARKLAEAS